MDVRALAVLRCIRGEKLRHEIVCEAVWRVSADGDEMKLLQLVEALVSNVGKQSARELLAKLGWWLIENDVGGGDE